MLNQELIQKNEELAKNQNLEVGYYYVTQEYGNLTGNRYSISTTVFHAIKEGKKLLNKTFVERKETDLVRNFNPTKSTMETHEKKINKIIEKYPNIQEFKTL